MDMKIIKIAICFAALSGFGFTSDEDASAGIRLDSITTISGKVYKSIELITADDYGLLFRHTKGTAKVNFEDLNYNLREMFEPEPTVPAMEKKKETEVDPKGAAAADPEPAEKENEAIFDKTESLVIYTRSRIVLPPQQAWWTQPCNPQINWLSHWSRYHPGHRYANFHCRQLAEYDFLISSGILPPPPGVVVRRIRR